MSPVFRTVTLAYLAVEFEKNQTSSTTKLSFIWLTLSLTAFEMFSCLEAKVELDHDTMNAPISETAETSITDVTTVLTPLFALVNIRDGPKNRISFSVSCPATTYETFSNRNLKTEMSDWLFV